MLLAVLAAAACVKPATETQTTYRDAGLNLYSNAVFDAARLDGTWAQVAAFTGGNTPDSTRRRHVMHQRLSPHTASFEPAGTFRRLQKAGQQRSAFALLDTNVKHWPSER